MFAVLTDPWLADQDAVHRPVEHVAEAHAEPVARPHVVRAIGNQSAGLFVAEAGVMLQATCDFYVISM